MHSSGMRTARLLSVSQHALRRGCILAWNGWGCLPRGHVSAQGWIQDLVKGEGAQFLRPKVADVVKWSRMSKASNLWLGSRAHLRALEAFGFLMLKYAFSHILETLFL